MPNIVSVKPITDEDIRNARRNGTCVGCEQPPDEHGLDNYAVCYPCRCKQWRHMQDEEDMLRWAGHRDERDTAWAASRGVL